MRILIFILFAFNLHGQFYIYPDSIKASTRAVSLDTSIVELDTVIYAQSIYSDTIYFTCLSGDTTATEIRYDTLNKLVAVDTFTWDWKPTITTDSLGGRWGVSYDTLAATYGLGTYIDLDFPIGMVNGDVVYIYWEQDETNYLYVSGNINAVVLNGNTYTGGTYVSGHTRFEEAARPFDHSGTTIVKIKLE